MLLHLKLKCQQKFLWHSIGILTLVALVDVDVAVGTDESLRARAVVLSGHDVRLADGTAVAGVAGTSIVQMTEESGLSRWAFAIIIGDAVMASSAGQTRLRSAVVDVNFTILAFVPVDADALVSPVSICAGRPVLTRIVHGTFVHVLGAIFASELGCAVALVAAYAVDAFAAILAEVVSAVIDVNLASIAGET